MNALDLIEQVRAHDADLFIENERLIVRGTAARLPEDLQRALVEHKAELMLTLGVPLDRAVASVMRELKPRLPAALRQLPDDKLLVMINWSIIAAWESRVRSTSRWATR